MTNAFFERPILNSPYEYPKRHWQLDDAGQPTNRIEEHRRRAKYVTPIPKPKKQKRSRHSYAENHRLGFEVPYQHGSEARRYGPDFIVRIDDGHDDLLNLVVEIKGYRGEDAKEKKSTMETYWVPGVNHRVDFGRWAFVELGDGWEMERDLSATLARNFDETFEADSCRVRQNPRRESVVTADVYTKWPLSLHVGSDVHRDRVSRIHVTSRESGGRSKGVPRPGS
jgi:hypothetical protein